MSTNDISKPDILWERTTLVMYADDTLILMLDEKDEEACPIKNSETGKQCSFKEERVGRLPDIPHNETIFQGELKSLDFSSPLFVLHST